MELINVGAGANDGTGDPLRTAFQKVNANTTELGVSITTSSDSTFNGVRVGRGGGNQGTNTVLGNSAGGNNTTGLNNTFLGIDAGGSNAIGDRNTMVGTGAGNFCNTSDNTHVGYHSGYIVQLGARNTYIGAQSGFQNSYGNENTAVGGQSGWSTINLRNTSCFGYDTNATGDNQVQLGNASTTTYVYGTVQNRSDLRDKADVQDTVLGLDFISKLRPVDYKWDMREYYKSEIPIQGELSDEDFKVVIDLWLTDNKLSNLEHNGTKKRNRFHHGFIAQEVKDLGFGGFQDHSVNGGEDVLSIGYDEFIAPMVKAIQELKAEIELLKMK